MKKYEKLLEFALSNEHYYTNEDLRFNKKINILLSNQELKEYIYFKENNNSIEKVLKQHIRTYKTL